MNESAFSEQAMNAAIDQQNKCTSYPKVGAVIVKNGEIISTGFRGEVSGKHAERIAIEKLPNPDLTGTTIYTTLEPCVEIHECQPHKPCASLLMDLNVEQVVIGVLDPNGKIYCQGYDRLLKSGVKVAFFTPALRNKIESSTFKFDCSIGYGPSGKRRVAVVGNGKKFTIYASQKSPDAMSFRWDTLQYAHSVVDLIADNESIACAIGAEKFEDISDPLVFRESAHYARMRSGDIAVLYPPKASFITLIRLVEITEFDITFQWQVRNRP
ncbi:CMP deaminase [Pseudomonas sp. NFACC13-1]|uniref:CMP deaminase n=1 Tax=Pseudomonas sp. NFACC13-1 TaxID=1566245 RepID=UPI000891B66A|nr:CMP deaminase [Pseudomonas sp. NFACC13-1]SDB35972.1 diaminohydroxyphosphoribosylaminopyrimidine deaminase [Pseudomonas sp. NFACC13-1]